MFIPPTAGISAWANGPAHDGPLRIRLPPLVTYASMQREEIPPPEPVSVEPRHWGMFA